VSKIVSKAFFFEKKNQKTFALGCRAFSTPREAEQSFFGYLRPDDVA
jgi:hypothetical protein